MKDAVTSLYAYILRFLIRAHDWYNEGSFKHAYHSLTRPTELRYNDIVQQMTDVSRSIYELAVVGQQAELRDMHLAVLTTNQKVDMTIALMQQMSAAVSRECSFRDAYHVAKLTISAVQSTAMLDTNYRLSDLQYDRIIATLMVSIPEPKATFEHHHSLRRQRLRSGTSLTVANSFWQSPKMRNWSFTQDSALSIIHANFQARFVVRDLCVDILEQLKAANMPYLLVLKMPDPSQTSTTITISDLIRYLVKQAIDIQRDLQSEKSMALSCAMFHDASTENEWFGLLQTVLSELGGLVHILIDLDILPREHSQSGDFSWIASFERFFADLESRGLETKIKVLFVSYGALQLRLSASERTKFVVPAKTEIVTARQRRAGRAPQPRQMCYRLLSLPDSPDGGNRIISRSVSPV